MRDVASPGTQTLRAVPLPRRQKLSLDTNRSNRQSDGRLSVESAHPERGKMNRSKFGVSVSFALLATVAIISPRFHGRD
jgi:hypothetical protein